MSGKQIVFGFAASQREAEKIVHDLEAKSFSDNHISVVFPDKGALKMPGLGGFIAAGPLISALGVAVAGGCQGGLGDGLIGLGVPVCDARRYEGNIEEGEILISVHAESIEEIARAKEVFAASGARDICTADKRCLFP